MLAERAKHDSKSKLGTVPIFVRRKWDCPLGESGSYCWTTAERAKQDSEHAFETNS